ncbi:unnamed protein product, partial [Brenthis ino]
MRRFDGQGRGRAILPRTAASASLLRALFLENNSMRVYAQYTRVNPPRRPAPTKVTRNMCKVAIVRRDGIMPVSTMCI